MLLTRFCLTQVVKIAVKHKTTSENTSWNVLSAECWPQVTNSCVERVQRERERLEEDVLSGRRGHHRCDYHYRCATDVTGSGICVDVVAYVNTNKLRCRVPSERRRRGETRCANKPRKPIQLVGDECVRKTRRQIAIFVIFIIVIITIIRSRDRATMTTEQFNYGD